ncbi:hypothetical protein NCS56_01477200 [Fusarium sp. Ph1]|nr:hypothetical protein NCS56_01477200 [Fusarium sp. Ph1]
MASSWDLLDPEEEAELHKSRLLNRRLERYQPAISEAKGKPEQLKEELALDFAAFDSSITRLQFLHDANIRERERYAADQDRILAECQAVRQNNTQLREQLEAAQATLAQRKKFDELAEKITSNRLLRPREDQIANLAKLEEECRELERESETYNETWRERRDRFNRIMEEVCFWDGKSVTRREEVDRREGMNEGAEDDGEVDKPGQGRHRSWHTNPDALNGGRTPMRGHPGPRHPKTAVWTHWVSGTADGSLAPSRDATPMPQHDERKAESGEDVDMEGSEATSRVRDDGGNTPRVTIEPPEANDDKMEVDN